jgi:alpha-tubulin suppressor-like RCC1 family protein
MSVVVGFGWNGCGQLGERNYLHSVPAPSLISPLPDSKEFGSIREVSTGQFTTLMCTTQGYVIGLGSDECGLLGGMTWDSAEEHVRHNKHCIQPRVLTCFQRQRVVRVACGAEHAGAITVHGTVLTWGRNNMGQCGRHPDPDNPIELVPRECGKGALAYGIVDLCMGFAHTVALCSEGKAYSFGDGKRGQLGLGTEKILSLESQKWVTEVKQADFPELITSLMVRVVAIAAGDFHSCFLGSSGHVWACGENSHGRLGIGNEQGMICNPVLVKRFGTTRVKWEDVAEDTEEVRSEVTEGIGADAAPVVERHVLLKALKIGAGGAGSFALGNDDRLYTWGCNIHGQLGLGHTDETLEPSAVPGFTNKHGINIRDAALGEDHTVFLSETGNLYACGKAQHGRLGGVSLNTSEESGIESKPQLLCLQSHEVTVGFIPRLDVGGAHTVVLSVEDEDEGFVDRLRRSVAHSELDAKRSKAEEVRALQKQKEKADLAAEKARKEREEAEYARKLQQFLQEKQVAAENERRLAVLETERLEAQRVKQEEEEKKKAEQLGLENKRRQEEDAAMKAATDRCEAEEEEEEIRAVEIQKEKADLAAEKARKEREEAEYARKLEAAEAAKQAAAENERRLAVLETERLEAQRVKQEEEEKKKAKAVANDKSKGENKTAGARRREGEVAMTKAAETNRKFDEEVEDNKKMAKAAEGTLIPEEKKQEVLTFEWVT